MYGHNHVQTGLLMLAKIEGTESRGSNDQICGH